MDEKEKQKPLTFRRTVEQVIAGESYNLEIANKNGRLSLSFNKGDYDIIIDDNGISFKRTVYRPNHDHNDEESFQVGVDDKILGVEKGKLQWLSRFPYQKEGRDFFRVDFGARRVEY